MLDRAKAAAFVGGSVASTMEVNEEENDAAMSWLASHVYMKPWRDDMGETVEEVRGRGEHALN